MMPFSTGLGWSVAGIVGLDLDSCWAGLRALDRQAGDMTAAGLICRL